MFKGDTVFIFFNNFLLDEAQCLCPLLVMSAYANQEFFATSSASSSGPEKTSSPMELMSQ